MTTSKTPLSKKPNPFRVLPNLIEQICERESFETRVVYRAAIHILSISRNRAVLRQMLALNPTAFKVVSALVVRLMQEGEGDGQTHDSYIERYDQSPAQTSNQVAGMFFNTFSDEPEFRMETTGERLIRFLERTYGETFREEYKQLVLWPPPTAKRQGLPLAV